MENQEKYQYHLVKKKKVPYLELGQKSQGPAVQNNNVVS